MGDWSRHAVLASQLERHCLFCEETFTSAQQVERHIRWPEHRARRDAIISNQDSVHQRIYKIRELHYCESCNCALVDENEVSSHIALPEHERRTREPLTTFNHQHFDKGQEGGVEEARNVAGGVVLFGKFYCGQRAWNGICGGSCVVCNMSVEDATQHCTSRSHLLQLLSSRVRRHHTGELLYRQINEWFFQCMTCNKVIPQSLFTVHAGDAQHCDMLSRCRVLASSACAAPTTPTAPHPDRKLARRHTFTPTQSPYSRPEPTAGRLMPKLNDTDTGTKEIKY